MSPRTSKEPSPDSRTDVNAKARILVGIDFSEGASFALAEARSLVNRLGAELDLVYVEEGREAADWRADDEVRAWLERESVEADTVSVRHGFPWLELSRHARDTGPTFVVVGSHGRSGFQPLAMGSTAARLGVSSPSPVLVVPRQGNGQAGSRRA
jgi:nucleotide-binding universal stress UspA family protein